MVIYASMEETMSAIRFDYDLDDYVQWNEFDATVVGVDRENGFVTIECHEMDGSSFTINLPDSGRQVCFAS